MPNDPHSYTPSAASAPEDWDGLELTDPIDFTEPDNVRISAKYLFNPLQSLAMQAQLRQRTGLLFDDDGAGHSNRKYSVGDRVLYNSILWECVSAITVLDDVADVEPKLASTYWVVAGASRTGGQQDILLYTPPTSLFLSGLTDSLAFLKPTNEQIFPVGIFQISNEAPVVKTMTIPSSQQLYITELGVICHTPLASGTVTVGPKFKFGISGDDAKYLASTEMSNCTTQGKRDVFRSSLLSDDAAEGVFVVTMTNAVNEDASDANMTVCAYVKGFLVQKGV